MSKPIYIRAKREKTILFLCIDPKDSLDQLKNKLCKALDNKKTSDEVRLLTDGKNKGEYKLVESAASLENNDIAYFVYFDREKGEWESVHVIEPELIDEEEEVPVTSKKEKGKGRA